MISTWLAFADPSWTAVLRSIPGWVRLGMKFSEFEGFGVLLDLKTTWSELTKRTQKTITYLSHFEMELRISSLGQSIVEGHEVICTALITHWFAIRLNWFFVYRSSSQNVFDLSICCRLFLIVILSLAQIFCLLVLKFGHFRSKVQPKWSMLTKQNWSASSMPGNFEICFP